MADIMNYSEIKKQFDSEWVLIGDPETDDNLSVTRGTPLWHSKNRDEVYRKAKELKPKHSAILYLGTLPTDAAVIL